MTERKWTNNDLKTLHIILNKDQATRTSLKTGGELGLNKSKLIRNTCVEYVAIGGCSSKFWLNILTINSGTVYFTLHHV